MVFVQMGIMIGGSIQMKCFVHRGREITLSSAAGSVTFPANFVLAGNMSPCPCDDDGVSERACTCSNSVVQNYRKRISGPLPGCSDIHVQVQQVQRVHFNKLTNDTRSGSSESLRERVQRARPGQRKRFAELFHVACNAAMHLTDLREFCLFDEDGHQLIGAARRQLHLNALVCPRVLQLAPTIANLDRAECIGSVQVNEAILSRPGEMVY
jgi:magnesium chelatase family protein